MSHSRTAADLKADTLAPQSLQDVCNVFVEGSFDGMLLLDTRDRILKANPPAARLLGHSLNALVGKRVRELVSLREHSNLEIARARLEIDQARHDLTDLAGTLCTLRRTDQSIATVIIRRASSPAGHKLWVIRDVARYRPVAERLERKTRLLMEAERVANLGAWELDPDSGKVHCSRALQRILGFDRLPPLLVEEFLDFYGQAARERVRKAFFAAMHYGKPYDREIGMTTRDGRFIWAKEMCRAAIRHGRVVSLTGIIQDVTESRGMTALLPKSVDFERARLGVDLHDGVGQKLSGLALALEREAGRSAQVSPDLARELKVLSQTAHKAIETIRDTTEFMLPLGLLQLGFKRACQALADRTERITGATVRCRFLGHSAHMPAGPMAEHLYRIAQESIANAIRYGHAQRITLSVNTGASRSVLTVSNRSDTIDLDNQSAEIGLQIMQYRARMLGGVLSARRMPRGGTKVQCTVPHTPPAGI
jgi:PAS domain S-box-containing protein